MGTRRDARSETEPPSRSAYAAVVRELGDRLVAAQRPLRVLDAVAWDESVERGFFDRGERELPPVDRDYYQRRPLPFEPDAKRRELVELERDVRYRLGPTDPAGRILGRMCRQYRSVVELLEARGTRRFAALSRDLFGSTLRLEWGDDLRRTLAVLRNWPTPAPDGPLSVGDEDMAAELGARLAAYFGESALMRVRVADNMTADAAAGCSYLKVRRGARFRAGDLPLLEVHEGWVHLGTTLNGLAQPACTFLAKGPPVATRTQEGLAVLMELLTGSAHAARLRRLANRLEGIAMAEAGADFREVYAFFRESGEGPREGYQQAARLFRGSLPAGCGPFTKDLCYADGLVRVYRRLRARPADASLLFCGKVAIEDLADVAELHAAGVVRPPRHLPPPLRHRTRLAEGLDRLAALGPGQ